MSHGLVSEAPAAPRGDDGPPLLDDALAEALLGGVRAGVVAVDGPSGSGKSTLAGLLAARLGGAPVLHVDELVPGWGGLDRVPHLLTTQVLEPRTAGRAARYRRWDWRASRWGEGVDVPGPVEAPVLVVEGVGCGARRCAPHLARLVWVEAPSDLRYARGIARDGDAYAPHWQRWMRQEVDHYAAERTRERARVRLRSDGPLALLP